MDLSIQVSCWESCRLTVVRTPAFPGRHRSSHKNRKGDPKHGIESLTIEMQTFLVGKREQFRDSTSLLHCTGHRGVRRWGDFSFIFISAQFSSASLLPLLLSSGLRACSSWVFLYVRLDPDLGLGLRPSVVEPQFCYSSAEYGNGGKRRETLRETPTSAWEVPSSYSLQGTLSQVREWQ